MKIIVIINLIMLRKIIEESFKKINHFQINKWKI